MMSQNSSGTNSGFSKNTIATDYNKPLRIPAGCDTFRSIQGSPATTVNFSLDKYKNSLIAHFDQVNYRC